VTARVQAGLLVFLVAIGAVALSGDLSGLWRLAIWLPLAVILALEALPLPGWAKGIGVVFGAVVIPTVALLGVDWLWPSRLDPIPSLVVGAVLVGYAAWIWLGPWPHRVETMLRPMWAVLIAMGLVVTPPLWFALFGAIKGDERALSQPAEAVSTLDVVVLRAGSDATDPKPAGVQGWKVRTWVGAVAGDRITWGSEGPPPPGPEENADRVLLLMADGDPGSLQRAARVPQARAEAGEVSRWLGLADQAASSSTPTFALLRTKDQSRLKRWDAALTGRPGSTERRGDAVSLETVEGARTTTDLALRLAVRSRTSDADLVLAAKYRPALFFDSREPDATPLNVDQVLNSGKMRLCDRGQALHTLCSEVHGSADLHNSGDHLAFDPHEVADIKTGTTIYVNVTRSGNDHPNTIYLDYWWYLSNNPTGAAGGALCGAGFVIAGVTCFDHESDWEGVTVVLDADSPTSPPSAVSYAQHNGVTRYTWPALQRLWDNGDRARFGKHVNSKRPLVFIARGTHAAYPTSCTQTHCRVDGVPGIHATKALEAESHDGGKPWPVDEAANCILTCVTALPTRHNGTERARWNAFEGHWGTTNCLFGIYCASSPPPRVPGSQGRYERPWCAKEGFSFAAGRFKPANRPCTDKIPSESELAGGKSLLALGDSFSAGEGAGSYDPSTNNPGRNTCHRSRLAWPTRVADKLGLVALPSLACSGAVVREVTDGGRRHEPERQISQISRISHDPDVITITIGGNDLGFASVLEACVFGNCRRHYSKPSGDILEHRITALASELPGAYARIRRAAPNARLVVMGYPRLFADGDLGRAGNCAAFGRITTAETNYLNALVRKTDIAIAGAAEIAGADFIDVTDAFDGQELRCSGPSYMNRLKIVPRRLFKASFHPNARGYARLADLVADRLAGP
jgi:lysophospholipase L1-like esterase